ncbi:MAG: helix-turn-helix domain-containing protein, partial [Tannerella sp.]|nr:helix-turn-helix domain-containing protein [Tannerella sp.]
MNEEIKQIAQRLKGLRDALEIPVEDIAGKCKITPKEYMQLESGTVDISVSILYTISKAYGVELTALMFGDDPKMSAYFVTRSGKGVSVERTKAYKYQSLAAGFTKRKADPFM